jgi:hypothetical protein
VWSRNLKNEEVIPASGLQKPIEEQKEEEEDIITFVINTDTSDTSSLLLVFR